MNRWQALVEIVKSFNDRGATTTALVALCIIVIVPLIVGLIAVMNVDWAQLHLPWFGFG
ncbi:MAG TPA: hypothetical protein VEZ20_13825 [Allosphingosinicella sp.]|jgi:hypothetical protein|nr:hypothetical protein [Allosphingosinicella sp.]